MTLKWLGVSWIAIFTCRLELFAPTHPIIVVYKTLKYGQHLSNGQDLKLLF